MKFQVSTNDMRSALQISNMALQAKTPSPILECVLMTAEEGSVTLTCSDSILSVSYTIPADVEIGGEAAIRGRLLEDVVKRTTESGMTVEVADNFTCTLRSGRAKSRLAGSDPVEYPGWPDVEATSGITLPANDFCDMISGVESCIAVEDMRMILTGGCIDVAGGVVNLVGLDGYRMGVRELRVSSCPEDTKVIIPLKSLSVIKKLLSGAGDDLIDLSIGNGNFAMTYGPATIKSRLIQGEYVDWRKLVPATFSTLSTVDGSQFRSVIDRASLIARQGGNNLIKLSVAENTVTVYAKLSSSR